MKTQVYVSSSPGDQEAAAWMAATLGAAGHDVARHPDRHAGVMSVEHVQAALADGRRVVAILTDDYFLSSACMAEAFAALENDPHNENGKLVPVRLQPCTPTGVLAGLAVVDLVGLSKPEQGAKILEVLAADTRGANGARPPARRAAAVSNAPSLHADRFSGRDSELGLIHRTLKQMERGQATALVGPPGVGKTTLARAYCDLFAHEYDMIWWLRADTPHSVVDGLAGLVTRLEPSLSGVADINALAREALRRAAGWPGDKPVLVVFDHALSPEAVEPWRPTGRTRTLILTREAEEAPDLTILHVGMLTEDEAATFLLEQAERTDETDMRTVARATRGLPLALSHACAFLRENPVMSGARYVSRMETAEPPPLADADVQTAATTSSLAISDAVVSHPAALAVLSLAAWCAPEHIPVKLIEAAAEHTPDAAKSALTDPESLQTALAALGDHALITLEEGEQGRVFSVHPVVQEIVRARLAHERTAVIWAGAAIEGAAAIIPGGRASPDKWPGLAWLVGHAVELDGSAPEGAGGAARGLLLNQVGLYFQARVDFAAAEPNYRRALALFEEALGADHPHVATALHNLAALLQGMGLIDEAEGLMRRAVRIDEAARGRDDPVVAARLFTLVQLLQASERLGEAAPLQRRVVRIYEQTYGPDHPNVSMALSLWADILKGVGEWDEAEPLLRRALEIDEATFGPRHPNVAIALNNLAHLLKSADRLEEAEELMRRALAVDEAAYGPHHPEVATDLNNFAKLLHATGRLEEAEGMLRRAVAIWDAIYHSDHPETQVGAENLVQVLRAAGRQKEAGEVAAKYGLERRVAG